MQLGLSVTLADSRSLRSSGDKSAKRQGSLFGFVLMATALSPTLSLAQAPPTALPQTTNDATAPNTPSLTATQILPQDRQSVEEVKVTAERREEVITQVPISITSVSAKQLQDAQINTTLDLPELTPGLEVSHNGLETEPAIRGVSTRVGENSIALYIDGVYIPSVVSSAADLSDVERVDVLKGPQGTLFGRNATGGAIMITTYDPDQTFAFHVSGGAEDRNGYRSSVYVNAPLTNSLAFNLSANYSTSDGWLTEGKNTLAIGQQYLAVGTPLNPIKHSDERLKLLWTPTDSVSVLASIENGYMSDAGALAWVAQRNTLFGNVQPLPRDVALNGIVPESTASWYGASLKAEADGGSWKYTSLTAYRFESNPIDVDAIQNTGPQIIVHWLSSQKSLSEELNASGAVGPVDIVAGLFLYGEHLMRNYISSMDIAKQKILSAAPFIDATWHITDRISLASGLRYTYEHRGFDYASNTTPEFTLSKNFTNVSPGAVLKYDVDNNSNVYVSYSEGFKSGLFNVDATGITGPKDPAAQALSPETLKAVEFGYKFGSGSWNLSLATYHYDWTDIQVNLYTNGTEIDQNAAGAEIYGAEGQFDIHLTESLMLRANGAYTHGRYTSFPNSAAVVTATSPGNLLLATDTTSPLTISTSQNLRGVQLPRAPDWSGNFSLNYEIPTKVGLFEISPNVNAFSNYAPDTVLLDTNHQNVLDMGAHAIASLTVNYYPDDHVSVALFVRNLTNAYYFVDKDYTSLGIFALPVEPRTVGVHLNYAY
jgi:iron complex outermembrane receptor protein